MTDAPPRQPPSYIITPSNPSPWCGAIIEGERFTRQQLTELARQELDPTTIEALTVRRKATIREMWWPEGTPAPVFEFECPILRRRGDGKVEIIVPGGWAKVVPADGIIQRARSAPAAETGAARFISPRRRNRA